MSEAHAERPPAGLVGLAMLGLVGVFAVLLFVPAGRVDWVRGWVYAGLVTLHVSVNWVCLARWNPELIARRLRYGKGTKTWDKVWTALASPLLLAVYVLAGLEVRAGAEPLGFEAWLLGLALFVPGGALFSWSMVVNPFFEKTVRIQKERGHRVVDTGPYAYVRHPGYVGFSAWTLAAPLLLGSAWALVPAALSVAGLVLRTALEDRTLQEELGGYREYAARVRYRLLPGVW